MSLKKIEQFMNYNINEQCIHSRYNNLGFAINCIEINSQKVKFYFLRNYCYSRTIICIKFFSILKRIC